MMALSGVRSSWLMVARNCDFAWLAAAAGVERLGEVVGRGLQFRAWSLRFQFQHIVHAGASASCAARAPPA
jgi:hypothetical protein